MRSIAFAAVFLGIASIALDQARPPSAVSTPAQASEPIAAFKPTAPSVPSVPTVPSAAPAQVAPSVPPPGRPAAVPAAPPAAAVPGHVLYQLYFAHLDNLDRLAARLDAAGRDGSAWRAYEQRAAGLSDEEAAVLKRQAHSCNQAIQEVNARARAVIRAFRAAHPKGESLQLQPPPELGQLQEAWTATAHDCVAALAGALGEEAWRKLDRHVQERFAAHARQVAVTAPLAAPRRVSGGGR